MGEIPTPFIIQTSASLIGKGIYFSPSRDIAIIRLGQFGKPGDFSMPAYVSQSARGLPKDFDPKKSSRRLEVISRPSCLSFASIDVTDDVFFVGFPASLNFYPDIVAPQYDPEWPLFRRGIIAGKKDSDHHLIVDGFVQPGNSGGPLFRSKSNSPTSSELSLIGIMTTWVPFVSKARDEHGLTTNINVQNAGYSMAEPVDGLLELIESSER